MLVGVVVCGYAFWTAEEKRKWNESCLLVVVVVVVAEPGPVYRTPFTYKWGA